MCDPYAANRLPGNCFDSSTHVRIDYVSRRRLSGRSLANPGSSDGYHPS
jgi:hypothetical protein